MTDNTMHFSYMTRVCNNILKTCEIKNPQEKKMSFCDKLAEKNAECESVSGINNDTAIFTRNMTMTEYKQYIYDKISALYVHPSNMQDSVSVQISEAGFEAMKNDPAYERWVLDTLQKNFQYNDPWSGVSGGKFSVFYFGATKEECHSESWRMGYRHGNGKTFFDKKSKDSFWERREKRRKQLIEQLKELDEKKAIAKRVAKTQYYASLPSGNMESGQSAKPGDMDRLAMQIFSAYEINVMLDMLRNKGVKG